MSAVPSIPFQDPTPIPPGNEFPEVHLGGGVTAQIVRLNAELAKSWLGLRLPTQRKLKPISLKAMTADLTQGRFMFNGEPIIFDRLGRMIDGQHRCTIVAETGLPITLIVIRGIDPAAFASLDSGAKRTGADACAAAGKQNGVKLAAAALNLWKWNNGTITSNLSLSPMGIEEVIHQHPGLEDSVKAASHLSAVIGSHGPMAFCHYLFAALDREAADEFFGRLATGEDLSKGNPILTLRHRLQADRKLDRNQTIAITIKAWNARRQNRNIMVLRWTNEESFPVPI